MNELYPEIHIKLFKRREIREMMLKFGLVDEVSQILDDKAQNAAEMKAT